MNPRKIIVSRKRGALATCQAWVYSDDEPRSWGRCGEPLILFFSPSPISALPFETLVIQRCPEHLARADGVLPEEQRETWRW